MSFYSGKKVLVTGGTGMIGSHLAEQLVDAGATVTITEYETPASRIFSQEFLDKITTLKADLTNQIDAEKAVKGADYVFQLAAVLTGVMGNTATPVRMLTPNLQIQTNMIEAAHKENVSGYFVASSACIYPNMDEPLKEEFGLQGDPDKNNSAHAWAKRVGEVQAQCYFQEFDMPIAIGRPFNSYGPRDNFHHVTSHVIAALIKRAEAQENPFTVWGDGSPVRDFVYVEDTARAMMQILEQHRKADPINIASGTSISMKELVELILKHTGHEAEIVYDKDKPAGQKTRIGSTDKFNKLIGKQNLTPLEEGIKKTVAWYRSNKERIKAYEL